MAKITLSDAEMNLVTQEDFILTKNRIIAKVYELFGNTIESYKSALNEQNIIPSEVLFASPTIYKGENYKKLPWVMLDFPKYFKSNDMFAIRSFFWWGNFVSINFLVQGKYLSPIKKVLFNETAFLKDWFLCNHQTPWQHSFENDNFLPIASFSEQEIQNLEFIKLAKKIPLQEWDNIEFFLQETFLQIIQLLKLTSQTMK